MKKIAYTLILIVILISELNAQFYNGSQMTFGKNRLQYKPFNWRYFTYDDFDVYFYDRGVNLGKYAAESIETNMKDLSIFFGVPLNQRILFVVYNKLSDFRQSNAGLQTGNVSYNLGGEFQLLDNKVFVYYEGDHQKFNRQIRQVIAEMYVNQILYGSAFTDKLTTSALLNVPEWVQDGLVSYVAQPYDIDVFNRVKDLLQHKKRITFNHFTGDDAVIVGHSFWYFIADVYGEDVISNILYISKINKSIKNSLYYVLGYSLKELTEQWREYYEKNLDVDKNNLPDLKNEILLGRKKVVYQQFRVSPDGKNIAFVENNQGKYKVFLYNTETQKTKKLYKEGQKLQQIVDYSYPVLSWNNNGKILAFTTEKKSHVNLWIYFLEKDETKNYILPYISKVNSFSFAPKGNYIVFSAVSNGFTDLFVFNLLSGNMNRITYDLADDINPVFDKTSRKIIFSSNRTSDTLTKAYNYEKNQPIADNFNIYVYDFKAKNNVLTKLTNTVYSNQTQVKVAGIDKYIFLSDSTGIRNRFALSFDSTIAFIDTAVHYRYFSNIFMLTDFSKNIIEQDLNREKLGQIIYDDRRNKLFEEDFTNLNFGSIKKNATLSYFAKKHIETTDKKLKQKQEFQQKQIEEQKKLDSLKPVFDKKLNSPDTNYVNINNYVFEIEKDPLFKKYYQKLQDSIKSDSSRFPQMRVYHPTFYITDMSSQFDFSMINQSYQPFTGGPYFFNPGMSMFTTITLDELFNDYKLLGGFRYGLNGSMEYLLSVENLKKRLDKQIVYHRQVLKESLGDTYSDIFIKKTITNEVLLSFRYPFNQTTSLKTTFIEKYDRAIWLSTEYNTLIIPDTFRVFSGLKMEYIFDNTRELALNLLDGIRFKTFGEFYQQVQGEYDYTAVLGGDFRFYKNIFRNMIIASRVAGSTSFGSGKVIYYLGGVDNWMDFSFEPYGENYFDSKVNINPNENYLFQAVATNMRGFPQNIRNGNTFILMNNEVRVPVVQMFMPYPVNSEFWYNLQIVGFFDIGSAWAGKSPSDPKNYYNTIIEYSPPFTVIVDVDRPPYVWGYGWGIRTKLFGYFMRIDVAHGVEANYHYPTKVYFSLAKDF